MWKNWCVGRCAFLKKCQIETVARGGILLLRCGGSDGYLRVEAVVACGGIPDTGVCQTHGVGGIGGNAAVGIGQMKIQIVGACHHICGQR